MKSAWVLAAGFLFAGSAFAAAAGPAGQPDCSVIPGSVQEGPSRLYEGDTLFEYMDGNSEGYFIYGFQRMHGVSCRAGGDTILIDVSVFPDSESAYGIFLSNRDVKKPVEAVGTGGQTAPRKAIFAKDRFFVEITSQQEGDHTAQLKEAARLMDARMPGATARPEPLRWFPPGMVGDSARLVPESVLGIRALKRGYVAQYPEGKAFVVTEDSEASAAAVMEKLRSRFPGAAESTAVPNAIQASDPYLGSLCIFRKGRRVAGYTNLTDPVHAAALVADFASRIPAN